MLSKDGIKLCGIVKHMEEWGIKYKLYKEQVLALGILF